MSHYTDALGEPLFIEETLRGDVIQWAMLYVAQPLKMWLCCIISNVTFTVVFTNVHR